VNYGNGLASALVALPLALTSCGRSALDAVGAAPLTPEPQSGASDGGNDDGGTSGGGVGDATAGDGGGSDSDAGGQVMDATGGLLDAPPDARVDHGSLTFASGPDWSSYSGVPSSGGVVTDALGSSLGPAVDVCLNQTLPPSCPAGAFLYGYFSSSGAWAGGQSLGAARWIWRADVTPSAPAAMQLGVFQKVLTAGGTPTGSIQISVDDFAEVFVNHVSVGTVGSVVSVSVAGRDQAFPTTFDLGAALHAGGNTITVVGQNGPFGCSSAACPYSENPAGVVFAGTIRW
jgi:hypothetical protein